MAETIRIEIPISTVDNTEPALSNVTRNLGRMADSAERAGNSTQRANQRVTEFDRTAERTHKTLLKWVKEKYEILLQAKEQISPIVNAVKSSLKSFTGKVWNITMKAVDLVTAPVRGIINLLKNPLFQAGAVLGVSIGITDSINTYKNFEAAMSQVQAVSGATGEQLEMLTEKAKQMGATTKFTAKESADAFNYMAMAGWKTEDMMNGIEGILNLAAASGTDLGTTSDIVTDALTAFKYEASESSHFADVLAITSASANTNVSLMGETFKYVGSMAGMLGYKIEDVALATGLMANAGVKGSMAGTALRNMFTRLATNTDGAADAIKELGVDFFDSHNKARPLVDVIKELRDATADFKDDSGRMANLAKKIAGVYGESGFAAILTAKEDDYNELMEAIYQNADGAAQRMSEIMLDNLTGSLTLLQSAVDGVKISFGERMAPYIRNIADWLTDMMPYIEAGLDDLMDFVDHKIEQLQAKLKEISSTEEWKNADFFGKVKIAWREIIAEPFSEWWHTEGRQLLVAKASDIGNAIGSGISSGLLMLFGIDVSSTADEGMNVGRAFASGFSKGFDSEQISEKLKNGLMDGLKGMVNNAAKLLPGGESADLSSVVSFMVLKKLVKSLAMPIIGGGSFLKSFFGTTQTTTGGGQTVIIPGAGRRIIGSAAAGTGIMGAGKWIGTKLGAEKFSLGVSSTTGLARGIGGAGGATAGAGAVSAVGLASTAGAIAAGAGLVTSVMDAYKASKMEDKRGKAAYNKAAGVEATGMAAGASAGALIGSATGIPVAGTLIGGGIGAIVGMVKGKKEKEKYQKQLEEEQREAKEQAEKAMKVYEGTGFSLEKTTFQTEILNEAINDTSVSAEQLGVMFREAASENMKKKFGDISLSLTAIKEIASSIVFDTQLNSMNKFTDAAAMAENTFSTLQDSIKALDKLNWKVALKTDVDIEAGTMEDYKNTVNSMLENAKTYLTDKHYEASVAARFIMGDDADNMITGLDSTYNSIQEQLNEAGNQLSEKTSIFLQDGIITLDEQKELMSLQQQVTDITNKLASAEEEASFESIKIRYGAKDLDAESFSKLQEEIQMNVQEMEENYNSALQVNLTNLKLRLSEGDIDQSEYEELLKEIREKYNMQIQELQDRVGTFQLDIIANNYTDELENILPEIDGSISEKLEEAMERALAVNPKPKEWTQEDVTKWFGLEGLSAETQENMLELLKMTAETIPESAAQALHENMTATVSSFNEIMQNEEMTVPFIRAGRLYSGKLSTELQDGITDNSSLFRSTAQSSLGTAFSDPFSVTAKINVTPEYNISNLPLPLMPQQPKRLGIVAENIVSSIGKHANGGYVSGGPQLSWLAEEGYGEFVIPTAPTRRARALELYQQAGEALGVEVHAEGGFVGRLIEPYSSRNNDNWDFFNETMTEAPDNYFETSEDDYNSMDNHYFSAAGTKNKSQENDINVSVNVSVNPQFSISGAAGQSEEDVMQVIRKHMKEMADELGGEIAYKLEQVFSNMPVHQEA